jgi:hypothetical protein
MTCSEAERYRDEIEASISRTLGRALAERFGLDRNAVTVAVLECVRKLRAPAERPA